MAFGQQGCPQRGCVLVPISSDLGLSLNTLSAKVCPCKHTTIKSSRTDWMCLGDALEIALGSSLEIESVIDGLFSLSIGFFSLVLGFNEGCKRCLVYTISPCHACMKRIFLYSNTKIGC